MIHACPACRTDNRIPASRLGARARCGSCRAPLLPLDRPYDVRDAASFDELVRDSPLPVVVDFWAPWCGPCRVVAPELGRLAAFGVGRVVVAKVNSDALEDVAGRYRIRGIPAFLRFDGGAETARATGAQPAEQLARALRLDLSEARG